MSADFVVKIVRNSGGSKSEHSFIYAQVGESQRPMALDVLLQAQNGELPDLAYRYGCRNGLCGVCTIDINGKPKLACRTKLRNGDRLSALSSLAPVRDLVVDREPINRQLRGRLPTRTGSIQTSKTQQVEDYQSLNRCIECYACLSGCPMHEKNGVDEAVHGNPYALLKIQQVRLDPRSTEQDCEKVMNLGLELGMQTCVSCKGCRCGVGIDLKKEVIRPLLEQLIEQNQSNPSQKNNGQDRQRPSEKVSK